jgi:hypothetical protein
MYKYHMNLTNQIKEKLTNHAFYLFFLNINLIKLKN